MKKIILLLVVLAVTISLANGQTTPNMDSKTISMKEDKVTQLIFISNIKSYKGGFLPSDFAITAEDNVLYIQPLGKFPESNINVITNDGCYYALNIVYDQNSTNFNFMFSSEDAIYVSPNSVNVSTLTNGNGQNDSGSGGISRAKNPFFDPICRKIISRSGYLSSGNVAKVRNVFMILKGVYTDKDHIYMRLELSNKSNIKYEIDFLDFAVETVKSNRRTTLERVQLVPLYTYGAPETILPKSETEIVVCLSKFTIGDEKFLSINCLEFGGERNLALEVPNTLILDAHAYE